MNDTQIALIKTSWVKVAPIAPAAATLLYDRQFTVAPAVPPLFPADISEQKQKLMDMLGAVVDGLDDIGALVPEVQALGARHSGYGARPEHYDVVGECLLWTLAQGLGGDFSPETGEAWATAYSFLAQTMIEAAGARAHA